MKFYLFADKEQKTQIGLIDLQGKLNAHTDNYSNVIQLALRLGSYDKYGVQSVVVIFEK